MTRRANNTINNMKKIFTGNTTSAGKSNSDWIIGDKMKKYPELFSKSTFIKWSKHKKGEERTEFIENKKLSTVTILVKGKIQHFFKNKTTLLEKEGDFVFYEKGVSHRWKTLKDSFIITIQFLNKK